MNEGDPPKFTKKAGSKADQDMVLRAMNGDQEALKAILFGEHDMIILEGPGGKGKTIADPETEVTLIKKVDKTE